MKFSLFFVSALLSVASVVANPIDEAADAADQRPPVGAARCVNKREAIPFFRAYNPKTIDHFYTTNSEELNNAVRNLGYQREGIAGFIFKTPQRGTVPLFRMWNPSVTDHFYTTSNSERMSARPGGYRDEGIAGYVYPESMCGAVALIRMYNARDHDHFYTTSPAERGTAQRSGYNYEGVAAWVLPSNK